MVKFTVVDLNLRPAQPSRGAHIFIVSTAQLWRYFSYERTLLKLLKFLLKRKTSQMCRCRKVSPVVEYKDISHDAFILMMVLSSPFAVSTIAAWNITLGQVCVMSLAYPQNYGWRNRHLILNQEKESNSLKFVKELNWIWLFLQILRNSERLQSVIDDAA